jgi:hypothetical protein
MSVEGRRGRRALASDHFGGAGALQLFMVNFHMETLGASPLLFCWKPNIQKTRMEPLHLLHSSTHPHVGRLKKLVAS